MNKKAKILLPCIYLTVIAIMVVCSLFVVNGVKNYLNTSDYDYALDNVFDGDSIPVMKSENNSIVRPYVGENITISKYFYDYDGEADKQKNSIIFYENTYIQNKGVDYSCDDLFDVVSVLDGEVVSINDDEIYGKILTIKHSDHLSSIYYNLSNVLVSVGYKVSQGELIASSALNKIDNNNKYLLHFEVIHDNENIDPESFYTLKVSELD